ncbi:MAG: thiamine pyrophosphate-dependent dehydrogenase E1 component subunit alpha [Candidatus Eiseniibacteriota bacterium]
MSSRTKSAGSALGHLDLSEDRLRDLYRRLWLSRLIDERGRKLFRQGRMLGNMYTAVGQEAITLVPAFCLKELDFVGPSHRELPASIGKGVPTRVIFAQILARAVSPDRGKSHPCHYGYAPLRVLTPASTVAAQYVVATGVALAYKMQKNGLVAIAYTGDGGTARGDFHEALNFAGVHKLPAVYFIQNNLWAESVPLHLQTALTDLSERAKAYGIPGITIDGNDVVEVYETASKAIDRARNGGGPTLIEGKTYRWYGHSEIDPANYRSDEEVEAWKKKDPLPRFEKLLVDEGVLAASDPERIKGEIQKEIEDALTWAEAQPYSPPEAAYEDVFAPGTFGGYR